MRLRYNLIVVFCFLVGSCFAKEKLKKDKITERQINVGKGDRLVVKSPYGDVNVHVWKKQAVAIRFIATCKGYPDTLIEALLGGTDVAIRDHENGSGKIEVRLDLSGRSKGNNINSLEDEHGNFAGMTLQYELFVPEDLYLDLDVRAGNVSIKDNYRGAVNVRIWGGQLFAKELRGASNIITIQPLLPLEQKSHIGYLENGYLDFAPELDIDSAGDVQIHDCKNLRVGKANSVTVAGRNNNLELGSVHYLYGKLEETNSVRIGDIIKSCELTLSRSNDIAFSQLSDVHRVHIEAFKSSILLGHLDNVSLEIHDVKGTRIVQSPAWLQKNEKSYNAVTGNGNGAIDIEPYDYSTITFEK